MAISNCYYSHTFENTTEVIAYWESGWKCLFDALNKLQNEDLEKIIYIRNHGHTVTEAINRQLSHYPYHVGQIIFLGKLLLDDKFQSLSIAKNASTAYNDDKFSKEKSRTHFTEDLYMSYIFTSERLGFRAWNRKDLDSLIRLCSDKRVVPHLK